ncbi:SDR family oxidoreductase [Pseudomonas sp. AH2]|uniref:SDR family oxidoreductase n=1 Tax=unclassified Pseudomonas TaxID=196821 RepID=UPI003A0FFB64
MSALEGKSALVTGGSSAIGTPEEVAAAALFLTSDESRYIAGAGLCIDGGMAQV